MNISFCKLGNEECEICERNTFHVKKDDCLGTEGGCEMCVKHDFHLSNAKVWLVSQCH